MLELRSEFLSEGGISELVHDAGRSEDEPAIVEFGTLVILIESHRRLC